MLDVARWQFAFTTVFHFLFVPLTIGLSGYVALMQTMWVRSGNDVYLRMTKFWGKLLLVNFGIGIATGLVQEFQFGMAWSAYSRFVGDVFGAPLAIEGLAAFFLESTFLGLWIFGWNRLPKKIHLATIWLVFIGTNLSAYFILAANAWMQHPVGYEIDPNTGNAVLTSIWAVLSNDWSVMAYLHTIPGALVTASGIIIGVSVWHLHRRPGHEVDFFQRSLRWALRGMLVFAVATIIVGHFFGQVVSREQPMKMAAAEALYESESGAPLSLFAVAPFEKKPERPSFELKIPYLYSFMATDDFNGYVRGINDLQKEYEQKYGPGEYYPIVGLTYWTFRLMVGFGTFMAFYAAAVLLLSRRSKKGLDGLLKTRWFYRAALGVLAAGFLAHASGWIFTEAGRQPWAVFGLLKTEDAVSQLGTGTVVFSLSVFVVLYLVITAIEFWLFSKLAKDGPDQLADGEDEHGEPLPALAY